MGPAMVVMPTPSLAQVAASGTTIRRDSSTLASRMTSLAVANVVVLSRIASARSVAARRSRFSAIQAP